MSDSEVRDCSQNVFDSDSLYSKYPPVPIIALVRVVCRIDT